jgi:hypothetical protein
MVRRDRPSLEDAFLELVTEDRPGSARRVSPMTGDVFTVAGRVARFRDQLLRLKRGGLSALIVL